MAPTEAVILLVQAACDEPSSVHESYWRTPSPDVLPAALGRERLTAATRSIDSAIKAEPLMPLIAWGTVGVTKPLRRGRASRSLRTAGRRAFVRLTPTPHGKAKADMTYRPMTMVELAGHLGRRLDEKIRWKYVWEFLEEYRWENADRQPQLLLDEPPTTDDPRWDALLAAMAEHLAAELDLAAPQWSRSRVLATAWFPSSLRSKRVEALIWAPAAFRKHGVYLSAHDLDAA